MIVVYQAYCNALNILSYILWCTSIQLHFVNIQIHGSVMYQACILLLLLLLVLLKDLYSALGRIKHESECWFQLLKNITNLPYTIPCVNPAHCRSGKQSLITTLNRKGGNAMRVSHLPGLWNKLSVKWQLKTLQQLVFHGHFCRQHVVSIPLLRKRYSYKNIILSP